MPSGRRYAAYLFDLDGTLVDTAPDLLVALNAVLSARDQLSADIEFARHWVGFGARVMIEQALFHHDAQPLDSLQLERAFEEFIESYQENLAVESAPYPGVVETLEQLKSEGVPVGVVTNKMERLSRDLLESLNLDQLIQVLVGGDTLQVRKPRPEPVLHACETLGTDPRQAVLVGDSSTDVETARAAGCAAVCVTYGYSHGIAPQDLDADLLVHSLLDVP